MNRAPKLRIHLVGSDYQSKHKLAVALRKELNKRVGRTTIVPDLQQKVEKRMDLEFRNHIYYLALENDYFRYQSDIATKTHNLIFVDSLVDRYVRSKIASIDMDLYFHPQFQAAKQSHLFAYGPIFDGRRSVVMGKYDVPSQLWARADKNTVEMLMEAVKLRIGAKSARLRRSYT